MSVWHRVFISNNARLWTNVIFVISTYKIAVTPLDKISDTQWWTWIAIAGGVELIKRVIAAKFGVVSEESKPRVRRHQPIAAEAATDEGQ